MGLGFFLGSWSGFWSDVCFIGGPAAVSLFVLFLRVPSFLVYAKADTRNRDCVTLFSRLSLHFASWILASDFLLTPKKLPLIESYAPLFNFISLCYCVS